MSWKDTTGKKKSRSSTSSNITVSAEASGDQNEETDVEEKIVVDPHAVANKFAEAAIAGIAGALASKMISGGS